jgi:hypothetical protein
MKIQKATFVNLNASALLIGCEATNLTFERRTDVIYFKQVNNILFRNNLILVDGLLPNILGETISYAYCNNCFKLSETLKEIEKVNPLNFGTKHELQFYTYKIKELLRNLALGMNASEAWHGTYNIYDHFPVLRHEGRVSYYSDSNFVDVLLEKANLVITIVSSVNTISQEDKFIQLNLQIELSK